MTRMRTAKRVFEIIKDQDPDTEITMNHVRSVINSGRFPVTTVGYKKLVDADAIIKYIIEGEKDGPMSQEDTEEADPQRVRRVEA